MENSGYCWPGGEVKGHGRLSLLTWEENDGPLLPERNVEGKRKSLLILETRWVFRIVYCSEQGRNKK